ncbi:MAG: DUF2007 domain-containing protein [Flavisolibacter sp.]
MDFAILQIFDNYIDAHIVMGRLQEEGINCWLKDENTVTIDPILTNAVGGIKIMVPKDQLEKAIQFNQQFTRENKQKLSCPECHSHNIQLITTNRKAINWLSAITSFFLGSYAIAPEKIYHCFNCNAEFKTPVEDITTSN